MAGEPGFEPGLTESESVGLPLTYSPITSITTMTYIGGAKTACHGNAQIRLLAGCLLPSKAHQPKDIEKI